MHVRLNEVGGVAGPQVKDFALSVREVLGR